MGPGHLRLIALLAVGLVTAGSACADAPEPPLRAGVAAGSPPFVIQPERGPLTGFTIELFRAIAGRIKRDIVFVAAPEDTLTPGLEGKTYDLLPGPIDATPETAAEVLLSEGYVASEYEFGTRADQPIGRFEDLRARRLGVQVGTPYAGWAERNTARYGFTAHPYPNLADALKALSNHEVDAILAGSPVVRSAAAHDTALAAGLSLPETRSQGSAAFRKRDTELRDDMEDALRCLKQDGTVARLANTWFGTNPDDEDIEKLAMPGYGVPGLAGFDPKTRKTHC